MLLTVNSRVYEIRVDPLTSLAEALREDVGLTGTKIGCNAGDCGACTVLVAGKPVMSCQLPVAAARGPITTVEGLEGACADALRETFITEGAFQCGYCTSGQLVACHGLVACSLSMSDAELAAAINGNICRCTGYAGILRAIRSAAAKIQATDGSRAVGAS
jgi:aerobic-type carbon monoxide dehydrogenase small subunit (CoxS/CutS family)